MCQTIQTPTNEIETVSELIKFIEVNSNSKEQVIYQCQEYSYQQIALNGCLCPIDIAKTLEQNGIRFEEQDGETTFLVGASK